MTTNKTIDAIGTWTLAVLGWIAIVLLWPVSYVAQKLRGTASISQEDGDDR